MRKVVLTGGPGGGKSSLLQRVSQDAVLCQSVAFAEEAIYCLSFMRMNPRMSEFQCSIVAAQAGIECGMAQALASSSVRLHVFHRGTLDPCGYWQSFGNTRDSFFEMTGTGLDGHYRRYHAVLHLQSAAVGCPEAYVRYPAAHRGETVDEAARLDGLLGELWSGHPRYNLVRSRDSFDQKMDQAMDLLRCLSQ